MGRVFQKAQNSSWSSHDWSREHSRLYSLKPSSFKKRFGSSTPDQAEREEYEAEVRSWNQAYAHAARMMKRKAEEESRLPAERRQEIFEEYLAKPREVRATYLRQGDR